MGVADRYIEAFATYYLASSWPVSWGRIGGDIDRLWNIAKRLEGEQMFTSGRGLPFEIIEVTETGLKIQTSTGHVHSLGRERIEGACCLWLRGYGIDRDSLLRAGFTKKAAGNLSYTPVIVGAILDITLEQAMSEARDIPLHPEGRSL